MGLDSRPSAVQHVLEHDAVDGEETPERRAGGGVGSVRLSAESRRVVGQGRGCVSGRSQLA